MQSGHDLSTKDSFAISVTFLSALSLLSLTQPVLGVRGKVWVAGGLRGGFCENLLEASPRADRANATGSMTAPPLAKAEPISDGASASGITDLRRGRRCCATAIAAGETSESM